MPNYLLECEIVGGEVRNIPIESKITIKPRWLYSLPNKPETKYAVLYSEKSHLKLVELSERLTMSLLFGIGAFPEMLLSHNYSTVVLELAIGKQSNLIVEESELKVVGFKAIF